MRGYNTKETAMELESNLKSAYAAAYKIACDKIAGLDWEKVSLNTNSTYDSRTQSLLLKYLNREFTIYCPTGAVTCRDMEEDLTTPVRVLLLHYLINAGIRPLSGNLISFKEIKGGGAIYYQTFHKRAIQPLIKTFGHNAGRLYNAGARLGGAVERYGSASMTLKVFPLVPVTYVIWQGDEEVPANATILFDDSVTGFLPGEDIVLAASFGTYELMKYASGGI